MPQVVKWILVVLLVGCREEVLRVHPRASFDELAQIVAPHLRQRNAGELFGLSSPLQVNGVRIRTTCFTVRDTDALALATRDSEVRVFYDNRRRMVQIDRDGRCELRYAELTGETPDNALGGIVYEISMLKGMRTMLRYP